MLSKVLNVSNTKYSIFFTCKKLGIFQDLQKSILLRKHQCVIKIVACSNLNAVKLDVALQYKWAIKVQIRKHLMTTVMPFRKENEYRKPHNQFQIWENRLLISTSQPMSGRIAEIQTALEPEANIINSPSITDFTFPYSCMHEHEPLK